jgi:hypothetical protein
LTVNEIGPYQSFTLCFSSVIRHPNRYSDEFAAVSNQKPLELFGANDRKAHVIEALRLAWSDHPLGLRQRDPNQYAEVRDPDACQPPYAAPNLIALSSPRGYRNSERANSGPPHQAQQQ